MAMLMLACAAAPVGPPPPWVDTDEDTDAEPEAQPHDRVSSAPETKQRLEAAAAKRARRAAKWRAEGRP